MEDEFDEVEPRGFRRRWAKRPRIEEEMSVADDLFSNPSLQLETDWEPTPDCPPSEDCGELQQDVAPGVDALHCVSSSADDAASLSNAFITGHKGHNLKMPWESSSFAAVFGDALPSMDLSMSSVAFPSSNFGQQPTEHEHKAPYRRPLKGDLLQCVRNVVDRPFLAGRKVDATAAIAKISFFLSLDFDASCVGQQLTADEDERDLILDGIMGTKSPSTVIKRANALLAYYRWHATVFDVVCIPFIETQVWHYIKHLLTSGAAPTRAMSFIQALRFARFVLQVDGAQQCLDSRRIVGQAELMLSKKPATRQARPLTVKEVTRLRDIARSPEEPLVNRVAATHFLLMIYGRCRNSDLVHVQEILHDSNIKEDKGSFAGCIQIATMLHKSSRAAAAKSMLLPIVVSGESVCDHGWLESWIQVRKEAGLIVSGVVNGAIFPAPRESGWSVRPCSETTNMLRLLLQCDNGDLLSHSMKCTALSWAAKCGVAKELRRLLGRHASATKDADSVYSRDLMITPVRELSGVIRLIKDGLFKPDNPRSEYFPGEMFATPGTPGPSFQPRTPAFFSKPVGVDRASAKEHLAMVQEEVKSELEQSTFRDDGVIEILSDEEATDSESDAEEHADISDEEVPSLAQNLPKEHMFIKRAKSGIVHCLFGIGKHVTDSVYANSELLQGKVTVCGRSCSKFYQVVKGSDDVSLKCKVCFRYDHVG